MYHIAVLNISAIGLKINKMDLDNKLGPIKLFTLDNIKMEKNMEKASLCGLTTVHMKEISFKTIFMGSVNINGKMVEPTTGNGKIIKCKVKEVLPGLMEENTLAIMFRIENKVLEFLHSKMEEFIKGNG